MQSTLAIVEIKIRRRILEAFILDRCLNAMCRCIAYDGEPLCCDVQVTTPTTRSSSGSGSPSSATTTSDDCASYSSSPELRAFRTRDSRRCAAATGRASSASRSGARCRACRGERPLAVTPGNDRFRGKFRRANRVVLRRRAGRRRVVLLLASRLESFR